MTEKRGRLHPLFDPASLYGRMRAGLRPEGKMRGYFHWLWARAKQEMEPFPVRERSQEQPLGDSDFRVLDTWRAGISFVAGERVLSLNAAPQMEIDLCLVREKDGKHTVGCHVAADEVSQGWRDNVEQRVLLQDWVKHSTCCRAFL